MSPPNVSGGRGAAAASSSTQRARPDGDRGPGGRSTSTDRELERALRHVGGKGVGAVDSNQQIWGFLSATENHQGRHLETEDSVPITSTVQGHSG